MKLSSRLQSRLAKRRRVLSHLEADRSDSKIVTQAMRRFEEMGMPMPDQTKQKARQARHDLRMTIKDMADDQQLDKSLLRMVYENENFSFILGGNMGQVSLVLENFDNEDESTRL